MAFHLTSTILPFEPEYYSAESELYIFYHSTLTARKSKLLGNNYNLRHHNHLYTGSRLVHVKKIIGNTIYDTR